MTLNEIRKQYKLSNKGIEAKEKAINEICKYILTIDNMAMINIYDWACCKDMSYEEKAKNTGKFIYDSNWKTINNKLYVATDFLMYIIAGTLNIEVCTANKLLWRCIYNNKLDVQHGKITFSECSRYGARYGSGEHPYCIY